MISLALPGRMGPPSFAEPWHAQAFAAVVTLSQAGRFTWTEWVNALAAEIARAPQRQGEESEAAYYRQWLAALERLLSGSNLMTAEESCRRRRGLASFLPAHAARQAGQSATQSARHCDAGGGRSSSSQARYAGHPRDD